MDIGASYQMTCSLSSLFDVRYVTTCLVGLLYGIIVVASREESIVLIETLTLKRIFFVVREWKCNLVYVSQLVYELKYVVLFTKTSCLVQDLSLEIQFTKR